MYDTLICIKDLYPHFTKGYEYECSESFESLVGLYVIVCDDTSTDHALKYEEEENFLITHFKIKGETK